MRGGTGCTHLLLKKTQVLLIFEKVLVFEANYPELVLTVLELPSRKLTYPLEIGHLKRKFIFQPINLQWLFLLVFWRVDFSRVFSTHVAKVEKESQSRSWNFSPVNSSRFQTRNSTIHSLGTTCLDSINKDVPKGEQ